MMRGHAAVTLAWAGPVALIGLAGLVYHWPAVLAEVLPWCLAGLAVALRAAHHIAMRLAYRQGRRDYRCAMRAALSEAPAELEARAIELGATPGVSLRIDGRGASAQD